MAKYYWNRKPSRKSYACQPSDESDFGARVRALCVRPCRYTEVSLLAYQRRPHTPLPMAFTIHLFVFLLKRRQNIWYFLLLISQSLSLTAVEEAHLCLSPLLFTQAQFKQLIAELWRLTLISEDELKKSRCSFPLQFLCTFAHTAKDECKSHEKSEGYVWKRAATSGSDCSISASSSTNMLSKRCDPFKNSTNASCGMQECWLYTQRG